MKPGPGQHGVRTLASSPATAESAAAVAHTSSEKREGRENMEFWKIVQITDIMYTIHEY